MAEGFWRHYAGDAWDVFSAGVSPVGVNPLAVQAMAEVGVDIGGHTSKALDTFIGQPFDLLITVCANADRHCPTFPGVGRKERWSFDDPAAAVGSEQERMQAFRRARDQIGAKIRQWLAEA